MIAATQRWSLRPGRFFESMNLERTFRDLRFAVQGRGSNGQFDRLIVGLPLGGTKRGLQRGVTHVDGALCRTGLARAVGHIGVNLINEGRLLFFRHGQVGLRDELDFERAVRFCARNAVCDFLAALPLRSAPRIPAPPVGIAHFARHTILHLRAIHGGARVAQRVACE